MPNTYGHDHRELKPATLDEATLVAIGRLIRAFAEYEEILTLFIGALGKLNSSQLVILLGRTALTRKMDMAENLAKIAGGEHFHRYDATFNTPSFSDWHLCRNAVAHGILLGVDHEGYLAFLTDKTDQPKGSSTIQIVASYLPDTIQKTAAQAEANSAVFAQALGLQSWLKKHQPQALLPHRKGRKPSARHDKQPPPPQSSEA
jgi:hypothetical protein